MRIPSTAEFLLRPSSCTRRRHFGKSLHIQVTEYPKNNLWQSWGCRCCVGDGAGGKANDNWSLYAVGTAKQAAA